MRFAKGECRRCGEVMITFKEDYPPFVLSCPICRLELIKYSWIDKQEFDEGLC